jgi:hypothetical protein
MRVCRWAKSAGPLFSEKLIMIRSVKIINLVFVASILLFWACPPLCAQNETIRSRYNESIEAIVQDILQVRNGYPELENFSRSAIREDPNGFRSISYTHDSSGNEKDPYGCSFFIGIKELNGDQTQDDGSAWEMKFPFLGLKVVVESKEKGEWVSFDLRRIVESNLENLKMLEQEYLPFRLELKAHKEVYSIREGIIITASLSNTGMKKFKVADLDENSLYCRIGNNDWGNPEPIVETTKVLNSYGTIRTNLNISGVDDPQDLWVACTYAIGFKGVRPYNRIKISIKPKS